MAVIAYLVAYAALTAPGWAIGRAAFGRHTPIGWITGAALGYGMSSLALWVPIAIGYPTRPAFALAWLVAVGAGVMSARLIRSPLPETHPWARRDTASLAAVLIVIGLLMFPLARLGERDADGNRLYRAYFTADFVWHTALASELGKYAMPPRNPYLASEEMHYYWTYFLPPSVIAASGPALLRDAQLTLRMNAFLSALLFGGVFFVLVRAAVGSGTAAAGGIVIALIASSAEGAYSLCDLARRDRPLWLVKYINIDAVSNWRWGGLRIDGLMRALWYNPQHSTSCALGMVATAVAAIGGVAMPWGAVLTAAGALALAVTFNPFVGGAFGVVYGLVVLTDGLRTGAWLALLRQWPVPIAAVAAVGWCVANQMLEGAGGDLKFGLGGLARHAPVVTLLVSLGPLLAVAIVGVIRREVAPPRGLTLGLAFSAVALALLYLVRLQSNDAWVGFRAGQLLQVGLAVLAARAFVGSRRLLMRTALTGFVAVVALAGLPTMAIDFYNAQDVSNREMGPGFRWTVAVTPAEQEAFSWIRRATPPDAIVQMDPLAHGRETWSLIPTFAARRMAAGQTISLLPRPIYDEMSARVSAIYASPDPEAAAVEARGLGIDYLYLDTRERGFHTADSLDKFSRSPSYTRVFSNREVVIYAVRR